MVGYAPELAGSADDADFGESSLSLQRVWMAVRRRWWIVATVVRLVVALGIWNTRRKQHMFLATATVRVPLQQAPIQGMQSPQGFQDFRVDRLLTETQVIRSAEVARRVVQSLGLQLRI